MAELPEVFMPDTISVQTYQGTTARGPVYATAQEVKCSVRARKQIVRNSAGSEVISQATIVTASGNLALFPEGSLIAGHGKVVATRPSSDGGLGAWQHLKVYI